MKFIKLFFSILSMLILSSCIGEDFIALDKKISFQTKLFSIASDEQFKLEIVSTFDSDTKIEFISDDEDIISVDSQGNLSPNAIGEALVSVIVFEKSSDSQNGGDRKILSKDEFVVIVSNVTLTLGEVDTLSEAQKIELASNGFPTELRFVNRFASLDLNSTIKQKLEAVFVNFKGAEEVVPFAWSSSDTSILEVDAEGVLTPIAEGVISVTVSVSDDLKKKDSDVISVSQSIVIGDTTEEEVVDEEPTNANVIGRGSFERLDYDITGTFEITEENGEQKLEIKGLSFLGLPDAVVYLSKVTNTQAGALLISEVNERGDLTYTIPSGTSVGDYSNVLFYCRRFNQPIGFGTIIR